MIIRAQAGDSAQTRTFLYFDADLSLTLTRYPVPNVTTQIARVCTRV